MQLYVSRHYLPRRIPLSVFVSCRLRTEGHARRFQEGKGDISFRSLQRRRKVKIRYKCQTCGRLQHEQKLETELSLRSALFGDREPAELPTTGTDLTTHHYGRYVPHIMTIRAGSGAGRRRFGVRPGPPKGAGAFREWRRGIGAPMSPVPTCMGCSPRDHVNSPQGRCSRPGEGFLVRTMDRG